MWESVWTTEDHLLFDDCTAAVEAAFAEFGFAISDPLREPSDHLAYELAFMAALLARAGEHQQSGEADTPRRHLEAAARFMDEHLSRWAHACLEAVVQRASTDFYRGTGLLCADTLARLRTDLAASHDSR
jgi:TorA maturation chaperone TorD